MSANSLSAIAGNSGILQMTPSQTLSHVFICEKFSRKRNDLIFKYRSILMCMICKHNQANDPCSVLYKFMNVFVSLCVV